MKNNASNEEQKLRNMIRDIVSQHVEYINYTCTPGRLIAAPPINDYNTGSRPVEYFFRLLVSNK